jgi:Ca2+-binding RTX toxin-like protein
MFCLDRNDKEIFLQGTQDDLIKGKKHVYLNIKAAECTNKTKIAGDPICAN